MCSFDDGELDELKGSILPFLKTHIVQVRKFIDTFRKENPPPLEFMIKYFILTYNIPFNLKFYLDQQSRIIAKDLGPGFNSQEKKHQLVSTWIKEKAANYRSHSILLQIVCFEKMKHELLQKKKKELESVRGKA